MKRFVSGESQNQSTLFPARLDDCIGEDNPVRAVDVFVDELNLGELGFKRLERAVTGGPHLSSLDMTEDHYLRLPQPGTVKPAIGARDTASPGTRRVNRPPQP